MPGTKSSGRRPDADSARSQERGYRLDALPPGGFDGAPPVWPLPLATSYFVPEVDTYGENPFVLQEAREAQVWADLWRTPQAAAWAQPSEQWRIPTIALYVRIFVQCERPDTKPALVTQLNRLADQIGLTPNGLANLGWKIAEPSNAKTTIAGGEVIPFERRERAS